MKQDRIEKFWDKLANQYDKRANQFAPPPIDLAKRCLNQNSIVLDFGCATGEVGNGIAASVDKVVGIDISSNMIEIAKRKATDSKIENVDYLQTTIYNEDLKMETFDVVIAFNILHFLKDTNKVLQRISELLKSDGIIIISTACLGEWSFSNAIQRLLFKPLMWMKIIPYMKFYRISELESALNKEKFQIINMNISKDKSTYFIMAKRIECNMNVAL